MAWQAWPGHDPHLALATLLVELEVLELKPGFGEAVFVLRDGEVARRRGQRLRALVEDYEAHRWPSNALVQREILAVLTNRVEAA